MHWHHKVRVKIATSLGHIGVNDVPEVGIFERLLIDSNTVTVGCVNIFLIIGTV